MPADSPFFSVCIPQHNRTSFLLAALASLAAQSFRDFELCISDDCSTDGREKEITQFLESSGMKFAYRKMPQNSRYDANLRQAIAMARGRFCFLLGNDDCLANAQTLENLRADMDRFGSPQVVITNFERYDSGQVVRRVQKTGLAGSGSAAAASYFRNFSFVSGVVLNASSAQRHATSRWDGSEMYQMYIGCRLIAEGGKLLQLERVAIREGIKIQGETVDAYHRAPRLKPCPIVERSIPLNCTGRLVADAIKPYSGACSGQSRLNRFIFMQIYLFTLPFWLVEYRRVQSWKFALGIGLGMRPKRALEGVELTRIDGLALAALYGLMSLLALLVPVRFFRMMKNPLYRLGRSAVGAGPL